MTVALGLKDNTQLDTCRNSMSPVYLPDPKQDTITRTQFFLFFLFFMKFMHRQCTG